MPSQPDFSVSNNRFSLADSFPALLLLITTLSFVYFFHFDTYVTSDSLWTAIAEIKLLKKGLKALLNPHLSHGMTYLFSYYAFYYGLLKTALFPGLELMHRLNLLNGFVFSANIVLVYFLLRSLSLGKTLSFSLALFYLLIPKVFLLSLYVNPNALSLFFFLAANIFWALFLKGRKMALLPIPILCLISILIRVETVLFYVSFISIALLFEKPLKRPLFLCAGMLLFALGGAWLIQKAIYAPYYAEVLQSENFRAVNSAFSLTFGSILKDAGCIIAALGAGLVLVVSLVLFKFYRQKQFRTILAFLLWFAVPTAISLVAAANRDLTRFLIPAFLSIVVLLGIFIRSVNQNNLKIQCSFLVFIYAVHFLGMPASYHAVKNFYPLKRQYEPGERIVTEWIPLGNIFEDIHHLKIEKRREWAEAHRIVRDYKKVIVLSNNTCRIPFYYFLDLSEGRTQFESIESKYNVLTKKDGQEFVFLDILPEDKRAEVFDLLSDKRFLDFKIYFPPFIPERVPELYLEVKEFCKAQNGRLIDQQ